MNKDAELLLQKAVLNESKGAAQKAFDFQQQLIRLKELSYQLKDLMDSPEYGCSTWYCCVGSCVEEMNKIVGGPTT
jgi:hypothetical protein